MRKRKASSKALSAFMRSTLIFPLTCACGKDHLNHWQCMRELIDTLSMCSERRMVYLDQHRMVVCVCSALISSPCPYRQYGFTLPQLLRPIIARRRAWLGELRRIAARHVSEVYAEAMPNGRPGLILFVQTFWILANFDPHVHVLAADGALLLDGCIVAVLRVPGSLLAEGFRREVLEFLGRNTTRFEPGSSQRTPTAEGSLLVTGCVPRCRWRR
jgi:hypothetical protein